MQNILVTGGTGTLGSLVVTQLVEAGSHVRIMSRRSAPGNLLPETEWTQADLETGEGLAAAVQGVDVIVHTASSPFRHTQQIDVDGTQRLLEQAHAAAVAHLVYISIVGIDRIPFAYYQCKRAAEDLIQQSDIPLSILRATQFHSLIDGFLQAATTLPLVTPLPTTLRFQPVAESEVAQRLREIAQSNPSGRLPDMGGPEVHPLGELARSWLSLRGMRRAVIPLWLPGKSVQGFRRGYNTCPEQAVGKITWAEWVKQKYLRQ
ncbi:SDR family oxidoreductase [Ktedonosporobacter rubrisoli]|uniref:SDR family oxidoreductase n=1 Tax=Ktedonosporobacter rubrisoli TaxID=2509675 RepID=A0A4P6JZ58_KTERU|nr:SDR family oxidoreductase [Ktedonosporobacter rubrisoli]QBD80773.1 SDR family oxidoreductase [Ktedonosporobacter rubrisoli]